MSAEATVRALQLLHDEFRDLVNAALDEGREDIALQLSDEHTSRAIEVVLMPA